MSSPPNTSSPPSSSSSSYDPPNETDNNNNANKSSSSVINNSNTTTKFGKSLQSLHFPHHPPHLLRLNNGSFGATPQIILSKQSQIRNTWHSNPDLIWPRLSSLLAPSRQSVADMIGCCCSKREDVKNVVLLDNATVGSTMVANDALRRYWKRKKKRAAAAAADATLQESRRDDDGDNDDDNDEVGVILVSNVTYQAVINAMKRICEESNGGLVIVTVSIPFPVYSFNDVIMAYKMTLSQFCSCKNNKKKYWFCLAILDHVSSLPSYVHPIHDLVRLCRDFNNNGASNSGSGGFERIFVDGAHALGTIPSLDVPSINADYYVGNVHKWMMCPPSAAFFWSRNNRDDDDYDDMMMMMHHPITSHHYNRGLAEECAMLGTRDYSAMMVVHDAITFYRYTLSDDGSGNDVYCRNHALALTVARYLTKLWGTTQGTSDDMATTMIMVGLPRCLGDDDEASRCLKWKLYEEYDIVVQYFYPCEGRLWLRLSVAVYNYMEEYEKLGDVILGMMETK